MLSVRHIFSLGLWRYLWALVRTSKFRRLVKESSKEALTKTEDIGELTKVVGRLFSDTSSLCSEVSWNIYQALGDDPTQQYEGEPSVCWEAPIGILIYISGRPALGLGVELIGDRLHVRQLQGARNLQLGKALHMWPRMFVFACMTFAEQKGLREVRVYKADQLPFYYTPLLPSTGRAYRKGVVEFQRRLRRRYDGTARQLGFKEKETYWAWQPKK